MKRESVTSETCVSCGACCIAPYDQDAYADIEEKDMKRMGKKLVRRLVVYADPIGMLIASVAGQPAVGPAIKTRWRKARAGPMRGIRMCSCAALKGDVMKKVECSIYDVRPRICRTFVPGSEACRHARSTLRTVDERA